MTAQKWGRPAAGREPAGAAILGWLADEDAPRLCVITGGEGCGKSTLLAWLVAHGRRAGTAYERRVHGFAPLAGQTATTTAWMLADQLSVAARTPGELMDTLAADARRTVIVLPDLHASDGPEGMVELVLALLDVKHVRLIVEVRSGTAAAAKLTAVRSAVMDLDDEKWTDQTSYASWAARPKPSGPAPRFMDGGGDVDLHDPASVCAADPWRVSVLYERSEDDCGGLRAAWLRAGASLTRDQTASQRAIVLLAALGDDADPRLPHALSVLADDADWRVVWRRVRGDIQPPWPGPARALAVGRGPWDGKILVADHQGTVRVLSSEDATSVGRLPTVVPQSEAVVAHRDGMVSCLDSHGQFFTQRGAPQIGARGLSALLDAGPTPLEQLVDAVRTYTKNIDATALAASDEVIAVADTCGTVHAFALGGDGARTATLHHGPVTALAATELLGTGEGGTMPLIYSGGADGAVRVWAPSGEPLDTPLLSRACPVTALAATTSEAGPAVAAAWSDGLVLHHILDEVPVVRTFHPGARVNALALTASGHVVVGTDETLVCLAPTTTSQTPGTVVTLRS
jgi:hypothetical protein